MTRYRIGASRSLSSALFARSLSLQMSAICSRPVHEETNMRARISRTNGDLGLVLGLWFALIEMVIPVIYESALERFAAKLARNSILFVICLAVWIVPIEFYRFYLPSEIANGDLLDFFAKLDSITRRKLKVRVCVCVLANFEISLISNKRSLLNKFHVTTDDPVLRLNLNLLLSLIFLLSCTRKRNNCGK